MSRGLIDLATVADEIHCPVCKGVIRQCWYLRQCLHRFCRDCFLRSLRSDVRACPVCRTKVASKRDAESDKKFDMLVKVLHELAEEEEDDEELDIASIMRQQQERAAALRSEAARLAARPWKPSTAAAAATATAAAAAGKAGGGGGGGAGGGGGGGSSSVHGEVAKGEASGGRGGGGEGRRRGPQEEGSEEGSEDEGSQTSSQEEVMPAEEDEDDEYEPEPWQKRMLGHGARHGKGSGQPKAAAERPAAQPLPSGKPPGGAAAPSASAARRRKSGADDSGRHAKRSRSEQHAGHGEEARPQPTQQRLQQQAQMTPMQAGQMLRDLREVSRRLERTEASPGIVHLHLLPAQAPPPPPQDAVRSSNCGGDAAAASPTAMVTLPPLLHPYLICPVKLRVEALVALLMKSFSKEAVQRVNVHGGRSRIRLCLGNAVPASQYRHHLPVHISLLQAEGHCYPTHPYMLIRYHLAPEPLPGMAPTSAPDAVGPS